MFSHSHEETLNTVATDASLLPSHDAVPAIKLPNFEGIV